MNNEEKIKQIEDKLELLRNELDKQDNNPQKSIEIRKKIAILVKKLEDEKGKRLVTPDNAKTWFDNLRRDAGLYEIVKYRQFFDL